MERRATAREQVQLVNELDEPVGIMEKLQAHQVGALHRAFSIFLFNDAGLLLLQRRAPHKYHSAGLWTNTCCSHPRPGEAIGDAARRRLVEEMGIDTPLEHRFSFRYEARFDNDLVEHELDHVFFGRWNGDARPDPHEVDQWRYLAMDDLTEDLCHHPERYTAWLKVSWEQVQAQYADRPPVVQ